MSTKFHTYINPKVLLTRDTSILPIESINKLTCCAMPIESSCFCLCSDLTTSSKMRSFSFSAMLDSLGLLAPED